MAKRTASGNGPPPRRMPPSRVSGGRILAELRTAGKKGDRAALALAVDQMRTLALSPKYWAKYLALLGNPLARLVDLLVIKQGERIAHQKGWKIKLGGGRRSSEGASTAPSETSPKTGLRGRSPRAKRRPSRPAPSSEQQTLFEL